MGAEGREPRHVALRHLQLSLQEARCPAQPPSTGADGSQGVQSVSTLARFLVWGRQHTGGVTATASGARGGEEGVCLRHKQGCARPRRT